MCIASSRRLVSWGAARKTAREKKRRGKREARERLWPNLTNGRSASLWPPVCCQQVSIRAWQNSREIWSITSILSAHVFPAAISHFSSASLLECYSLSCKTVNTRENFWNVYCFASNQKRNETAKDNCQTAGWISHDLTRNNELAFSSTTNLQFYHFQTLKLFFLTHSLQSNGWVFVERGKTALAEICVDGCDVVLFSKHSGSDVTNWLDLSNRWPSGQLATNSKYHFLDDCKTPRENFYS